MVLLSLYSKELM